MGTKENITVVINSSFSFSTVGNEEPENITPNIYYVV